MEKETQNLTFNWDTLIVVVGVVLMMIAFWGGWAMFAEQGAIRHAFSDCVEAGNSPVKCTEQIELLFED